MAAAIAAATPTPLSTETSVATPGTTQEEFTLDTAAELAAEEGGRSTIAGRSPWALAGRRLRRNYTRVAFGAVFVLVVLVCFVFGPLYVSHVSHLGPENENASGVIHENGKTIPILAKGGRPSTRTETSSCTGLAGCRSAAVGRVRRRVLLRRRPARTPRRHPTDDGRGRNTLLIGIGSAVIATVLSILLALLAAYFGGATDWIISRLFDLIWAFPVILLGIALGTASTSTASTTGLSTSRPGAWIPVAVIAFVFIPYIGRPLRGQVLALRNREFVEASTAQGAGPLRFHVHRPAPEHRLVGARALHLIVANAILTEVALSFLGAGVQPPQPSWGTMIADGQLIVASDPWLAILPGILITITVISLNVFGDGLRDALDPRAKVRIER